MPLLHKYCFEQSFLSFCLLTCLATMLSLTTILEVGHAVETNFSKDVSVAIDAGLAWLDQQGAFTNPQKDGGLGAGIVALALLERRVSKDQQADAQGYQNAKPRDQAKIQSIMTYIINRAIDSRFYAYQDGADLMALSMYLRTGGPNQIGAKNAINAAFDRIIANQNNKGYWCYSDGSCDDSSTTQFVMAGLAATRSVYLDPRYGDLKRLAQLNQAAIKCAKAYQVNSVAGPFGMGDRGHGYRVGEEATFQQTASGLWAQIIGGRHLNDPSIQSYLKWLHYQYSYLPDLGNAYFYYMWSSSKAYTFLEDSQLKPLAGNISTSHLGTLASNRAPIYHDRALHRNPRTDPRVPSRGTEGAGYYQSAHESSGWYYDYAYTLMSLQQPDGRFLKDSSWSINVDQAYALLVLERSIGGGCVDSDNDTTCDSDQKYIAASKSNSRQTPAKPIMSCQQNNGTSNITSNFLLFLSLSCLLFIRKRT